jgi:hypothetical protein
MHLQLNQQTISNHIMERGLCRGLRTLGLQMRIPALLFAVSLLPGWALGGWEHPTHVPQPRKTLWASSHFQGVYSATQDGAIAQTLAEPQVKDDLTALLRSEHSVNMSEYLLHEIPGYRWGSAAGIHSSTSSYKIWAGVLERNASLATLGTGMLTRVPRGWSGALCEPIHVTWWLHLASCLRAQSDYTSACSAQRQVAWTPCNCI